MMIKTKAIIRIEIDLWNQQFQFTRIDLAETQPISNFYTELYILRNYERRILFDQRVLTLLKYASDHDLKVFTRNECWPVIFIDLFD